MQKFAKPAGSRLADKFKMQLRGTPPIFAKTTDNPGLNFFSFSNPAGEGLLKFSFDPV
jgi:hypothetical protein